MGCGKIKDKVPMIQKDQPTCFPSELLVRVSSKADGTMLDRAMGVHDGTIVSNRTRFCDTIDIDYGDVVFQRIVYSDKRTYGLICEVDDGSTAKNTSEVVADALITRVEGVALMLPVADCVATVVYDPKTKTLALLHLGRHSTFTSLLGRVLAKMANEGAKLEDVIVWMSPSAHASHYIMEYFDYEDEPEWRDFYTKEPDGYRLDLQGYNRQICLDSGLKPGNIYISPVNTVASPNYFSHSTGDTTGRFAVMAMLH